MIKLSGDCTLPITSWQVTKATLTRSAGETVKPHVSANETPQWFYTLGEFRSRLLSSTARASCTKHGTSQHLMFSSNGLWQVAIRTPKRQKRHCCPTGTHQFRLKEQQFLILFIGSYWHLLTIPEHCRCNNMYSESITNHSEQKASSLPAEKPPAPTQRKFCSWPWIRPPKGKPN